MVSGLDFRTFNCFKKVCFIERNNNECSRSDPSPKDVQATAVKKTEKSLYKVQQQEEEGSDSETEPTVYDIAESNPKPWNPPAGLISLVPWLNIGIKLVNAKNFLL